MSFGRSDERKQSWQTKNIIIALAVRNIKFCNNIKLEYFKQWVLDSLLL